MADLVCFELKCDKCSATFTVAALPDRDEVPKICKACRRNHTVTSSGPFRFFEVPMGAAQCR